MRAFILVQILGMVAILSMGDAKPPEFKEPGAETDPAKKRTKSSRGAPTDIFGSTGSLHAGGSKMPFQTGKSSFPAGGGMGSVGGGMGLQGGGMGLQGGGMGPQGGGLFRPAGMAQAGYQHMASSKSSNSSSASSESQFEMAEGGVSPGGFVQTGCSEGMWSSIQTMVSSVESIYQNVQSMLGNQADYHSRMENCDGRLTRTEEMLGEINIQIQSQSSAIQRILSTLETTTLSLEELKQMDKRLSNRYSEDPAWAVHLNNGMSRITEILETIQNQISETYNTEISMLNRLQESISNIAQNMKALYDIILNGGGGGITNDILTRALDRIRQEIIYAFKQESENILQSINSFGGTIANIASLGDQFSTSLGTLTTLSSALSTVTTTLSEIRREMGQCRAGGRFVAGGAAQGGIMRHHKKSQSASSSSQQEESSVVQGTQIVQPAAPFGGYFASRKAPKNKKILSTPL